VPLKARFCSQCGAQVIVRMEDGRHREVCASCDTVFYQNPLPVASALVMNAQREVLLVRRNREPQKGMWCLPIGFAELGETIAEAALRELEEEAGIEGRVVQLLDVDSYPSDFYDDLLIVSFEVEMIAGTAHPGDDADEVGWFRHDRLPELAFPANDNAVRAYLRLHWEEWRIKDSFNRLSEESEGMLLSDGLVGFVREHAAEIVSAWLADVRTNPSTPCYANFEADYLIPRVTGALSQLGRWLAGARADGEIKDFFATLGREREKDGCALHEVVSSLTLLKMHIWTFARDRRVWERPVDVYRVLELNRRLGAFFDKAVYHATRGYAGVAESLGEDGAASPDDPFGSGMLKSS